MSLERPTAAHRTHPRYGSRSRTGSNTVRKPGTQAHALLGLPRPPIQSRGPQVPIGESSLRMAPAGSLQVIDTLEEAQAG
jgi:hypothetical protein